MNKAALDPRVVEGVKLFNSEHFFECHDVFEDLWNDSSGESKICIQGLIQSAVALYHALNGNYRGSVSQFDKALAKLQVHDPAMFGLESGRFIAELALLREIAARGLTDESLIFPTDNLPKLRWQQA